MEIYSMEYFIGDHQVTKCFNSFVVVIHDGWMMGRAAP